MKFGEGISQYLVTRCLTTPGGSHQHHTMSNLHRLKDLDNLGCHTILDLEDLGDSTGLYGGAEHPVVVFRDLQAGEQIL